MNPATLLEDSAEAGFLVERILASCGSRIVVTSCEDGAGTTLLCRVLATIASDRLRRNVVYVDLNLRHPAPEDLFPTDRGRVEVRKVGSDFENLPGWARRERVEKLLELPDPQSLMVVDTSPLGVFNRNNIHPVNLAEWTRDYVLVVRSGSTRRSALVEARALLARHGIEPRGAVFNARPGDGSSDPASITHWRDVVRAVLRARRELPVLGRRMRSGVHAARVVWRLSRPSLRRALQGVASSRLTRAFLHVARRFLPGSIASARTALSRLRSRLDRWFAREDGRWTRS